MRSALLRLSALIGPCEEDEAPPTGRIILEIRGMLLMRTLNNTAGVRERINWTINRVHRKNVPTIFDESTKDGLFITATNHIMRWATLTRYNP